LTWFSRLLIALFLLKLTWNMLVPLFLQRAARTALKNRGRPPGGVSMMPIVETALLAAGAITTAIRFRDERPAAHAGDVLAVGIAAIVLSYLIAVLCGRVLRRRQGLHQAESQAK